MDSELGLMVWWLWLRGGKGEAAREPTGSDMCREARLWTLGADIWDIEKKS